MTAMIAMRDVAFAYNGETVLQDVDLEIGEGDFTAVIGPNGGGKTTLLKLMLGLLAPHRGTIRMLGLRPALAAPQIGYVPQDVHINRTFPITAIDVVLMGLAAPRRRWRRVTAQDRRTAVETLDRLGVAPLAGRRIGALSGGQRQRIFIARALVGAPRLLLLDEPTASIDSQGQAECFEMLRALNREVTIVVVSHDLLVISRYAKSVACVNKQVHYHHQAEITGEMLDAMYPGTVMGACPVELVAHGLPHRVLKTH
jgi:zinc transport system ATP-binding protein